MMISNFMAAASSLWQSRLYDPIIELADQWGWGIVILYVVIRDIVPFLISKVFPTFEKERHERAKIEAREQEARLKRSDDELAARTAEREWRHQIDARQTKAMEDQVKLLADHALLLQSVSERQDGFQKSLDELSRFMIAALHDMDKAHLKNLAIKSPRKTSTKKEKE